MAVVISAAAGETKYMEDKRASTFSWLLPITLINQEEGSCALVFTWFAAPVLYMVDNLCLSPFVCFIFSCCPCDLFTSIIRPINMLTEENHLWSLIYFSPLSVERG